MAKIKNIFLTGIQSLANLVTSWGATTLDTNYPSEKLVKDSLDLKIEAPVTPTVGDHLVWNGSAWVSAPDTPIVGGASNFYLDITASIADNYTLSTIASAYPETINTKATTAAGSPVFIERFISPPLNRTSIQGGLWSFHIYAATSSNSGTNEIKVRINKRVEQVGLTATYTGAGATRTLTVSGGTPFVAGDAKADRMIAGLTETSGATPQTSWISGFTSSSVVTVTLTDPSFVNVSGVPLDAIYYFLFQTTTGDITTNAFALHDFETTQPSFTGLNASDRIIAAFFAVTDQASSRNISLYYGGSTHYTSFTSPITTSHNDLDGLNLDDYQHLTAAQLVVISNTNGTNTGDNSANTSSVAHSLATAVNDFIVASGVGVFVKKTLAEVKVILGLGGAAYLSVGTTAGTVADGLALDTLQNRFTSILKGYSINTPGTTARKNYMVTQGQLNTLLITQTSGNATTFTPELIYIKSTEYPTVNGVAPAFKIRAGIFTNDVAPAVNYSISLNLMTCPTASGGSNLRAWTIGADIGAVVSNAPAADSNIMVESAEFSLPADGWYSICFANDGTTAVSSSVEFMGELLVRN